jgi:CelD/BcsL family acetyltransferase involved in cellulose biosynthesis
MNTTVVRDVAHFRTLKDEWNALLENSINNTLFLRWEWMFYYYEKMSKEQRLFIIVAREDDGNVIGIAPFIITKNRVLARKRFLEFIGQRYSYHLGVIAKKDDRNNIYKELLRYLFESRKEWDLINFYHLSDDALFKIHLKNYSKRHGYLYIDSVQNPCKVVRLNQNFDQYMGGLDERFAKKLKYYLRSVNRDFEVELSSPDDEKSLTVFWRSFLDLHEKRVHSKGAKTILSNKNFQEFYYSIAQDAYRENNLSLVALKLNKEIAAVLLGIIWNKTFYFLNIGYKEFPKYSLGFVLPLLCIQRSIESGLEYFDFLGGGGDYKEKLGGVDKGGLSIQLMKPVALLENMAKKILKRALRKIL